jgi:uncharacterized repeat protein (TIGR03803 family)
LRQGTGGAVCAAWVSLITPPGFLCQPQKRTKLWVDPFSGSDGYFYGTTSGGGGPNKSGTVFKITTNGALTSLYSFTGGNDGANPVAALVQGSDGNFYGTTTGDGQP